MRLNDVFSEWQSERKDQLLINNRQAGRRNRGRNNNGRPSGGNRGGGDSGNRIDSRARGNAVQLLEKYKNMARDAQMAGDRVNAEYYLQFADHYFRVLADNRARQEEQQQRFRRPEDNGDYEGDDFDASDFAGDDNRGETPPQQQFERGYEGDRRRDQQRDQQDNRDNRTRRDRPRRERPAYEAAERQEAEALEAATPVAEPAPEPQVETEAAAAPEAPRARRGRPRKADVAKSEGSEGLDLSVLPPSIARADNDSEPAAEEAPRKRTRRARPAAEAAE